MRCSRLSGIRGVPTWVSSLGYYWIELTERLMRAGVASREGGVPLFLSNSEKKGKECLKSKPFASIWKPAGIFFHRRCFFSPLLDCRWYRGLCSASHLKQETVCIFKQGLGFFILPKVIWFIPNKRSADYFFWPPGYFSSGDKAEISQIEGAVPSDNSIYDTFLVPASNTEM